MDYSLNEQYVWPEVPGQNLNWNSGDVFMEKN